MLRRDGRVEIAGYKTLVVGEIVELAWESAEQDGFAFRAVAVQRPG
ncbi:hypothetical protein [Nocardioides pelophilus]|nr:hypothetical protein [Nocardioides pelophilus]